MTVELGLSSSKSSTHCCSCFWVQNYVSEQNSGMQSDRKKAWGTSIPICSCEYCFNGAVTVCWIQRLCHLSINQNTLLFAVLLLGTVQWDCAGFWISAGLTEIAGRGVEADDQTVLSWSTVMHNGPATWGKGWLERQSEREYPTVMSYISLSELRNAY